MEINFLNWLQTLHTPVLDKIMIFITTLGNGGIIWIALAVLLLIPKKTRIYGLGMGCALIMGLIVVNGGVKPLVHRIRPYDAAGFTQLLISKQTDYSFPSGHAQSSFACAWVLMKMNKKAGAAAMVLAALIAFSRMYLYVHYPTDILAGILFGTLWAWISLHFCMPKIQSMIRRHKRLAKKSK